MIKPIEVKLVMSSGEEAIRLEKRWVTRHRLVQQIDYLQHVFLAPGDSPPLLARE